MGQYDSSLTRVVPVFDILRTRHGASWLPKLLTLPAFGNTVEQHDSYDFQIQPPSPYYGESERKLSPPVSLLSWLIRHPTELRKTDAGKRADMPPERRELLDGIEGRQTEALALLRHNPHGAKWHLFEGETQPDVYIETSDLIVVIEGKRTEHGPTTHTTWMPVRHQILRHLDCAWEIRGRKQVVGFFIVEGISGSGDVPIEWQKFAWATIEPQAIADSLPHRGPEEQRGIARGFAGVTTWKQVCTELGIAEPLPEKVEQRSAAAK